MLGKFTTTSEAVEHATSSLKNAKNEISKLSDGSETANGILELFGMSGKLWRHFLNNIASLEGIRYSEIGAHIGSTLCSALYKNNNIGFASSMDNWSQFTDAGNIQERLGNNITTTLEASNFDSSSEQSIKVFIDDFNTFDYTQLEPIDIYFFDGPHDEESQKNGILNAFDSLADIAIVLVDDWNWGSPRRGTFTALESLPISIHYQCEIFTEPEGFIPSRDKNQFNVTRFAGSNWHNGVAIFVISKDSVS